MYRGSDLQIWKRGLEMAGHEEVGHRREMERKLALVRKCDCQCCTRIWRVETPIISEPHFEQSCEIQVIVDEQNDDECQHENADRPAMMMSDEYDDEIFELRFEEPAAKRQMASSCGRGRSKPKAIIPYLSKSSEIITKQASNAGDLKKKKKEQMKQRRQERLKEHITKIDERMRNAINMLIISDSTNFAKLFERAMANEELNIADAREQEIQAWDDELEKQLFGEFGEAGKDDDRQEKLPIVKKESDHKILGIDLGQVGRHKFVHRNFKCRGIDFVNMIDLRFRAKRGALQVIKLQAMRLTYTVELTDLMPGEWVRIFVFQWFKNTNLELPVYDKMIVPSGVVLGEYCWSRDKGTVFEVLMDRIHYNTGKVQVISVDVIPIRNELCYGIGGNGRQSANTIWVCVVAGHYDGRFPYVDLELKVNYVKGQLTYV
jgi:hypothetical protein